MENKDGINCKTHLIGKSSQVVIEDETCDFLTNHTNPPHFILGFAGVGMIGTIVANEIITQLNMKQIGFVLSENLPPITLFFDGVLKHPFRIYYNQEHNIVVSICEVPFQPGSYSDLARTLMTWALQVGIQDVIVLQGMEDQALIREEPVQVYAAAEQEVLDKIMEATGITRPPRGLIMGAEAAILNECLNNKLNGVVYLTPANPQIPAPEGGAAILDKISQVYKFPMTYDNLLKQRDEIKKKLMEVQQQTNTMHKQAPSTPHRDLYS